MIKLRDLFESTTYKMSKRNLDRVFDTISDRCDGLRDAFIEDGLNRNSAIKKAHEILKKEFPNHYNAWNQWIEDNHAGPFG